MKKNYFLFIFLIATICANAQIVNIPDANFKNALLNHSPVIDTNGDREIQVSEAEAHTSIIRISDNFSTNITDLTGLEAFINLTNLNLYALQGLNTTSIDVSNLTKLTTLSILHCLLNSLDISKNTLLTSLTCGSNLITDIDISNNLDLVEFSSSANNINSIDLSNNTKLEGLNLDGNQITSLDLSNNTSLIKVSCRRNKLQSLNLINGNNTSITNLNVSNNLLSCIQVDNVNFSDQNSNWIKDEFPSYSTSCLGNEGQAIVNIPDANFKKILIELNSLNVNNDTEIQEFEAYNYTGTSDQLRINDNNLIEDLTGIETFIKVGQFYINNTKVSSIDLSANKNLYYLSLQSNKLLFNLDVSQNINLRTLLISFTDITQLDLSKNSSLETFSTSFNDNITNVDLSNNTNLKSIRLKGNRSLKKLNISNGNNININSLKSQSNNALFCIQVDDKTYSTNKWTDIDNHSSFNNNCSNVFTLTLNSLNGSVTKTPNPENINNSDYDFDTDVTLTAIPDAGYQFDGWSGDASGNTNPLTITMDADKTITATFSKIQHTLTTNATNGTINTNPNAATYDFDTDVTLTATPNTGYQFDGWSGDASGNTNPLTITMDADKTVTAIFSKIQHTLTTNTANGTINTNPNATTFNFGTDVTLTATPEAGYQFDGWSGDASGNTNPLTITMDADKTVTATFSKTQHTLTTNANNGTINTNPNATTFNFGTDVTLTATPEAGYQFDGWSGDASGNTNPLIITMDADKTVTAIFSKIQHTLTTNTANGTINTNPNAATYNLGTNVTLTATPNAGYQFDGWSGDASGNTNPLTITMDADKTVTATFSKIQHTLTTNATNGTINTNPNAATYDFDTDVTLTATPNAGYQFDGWSGDASGNTNPLTITMDADKTVTATFSKAPIPVIITTFATGFTSLEGIGINSNNQVYVSEYDSGKIFSLDNIGNKTEFATSGFYANDIVFNSNNKLFVAAPFSGKILEADTSGNLTEYVSAFGDSPYGLVFKDNLLHYVSENNAKVVRINADKTKIDISSGFFTPESAVFDSAGNLYVTDRNDRKLFKITPDGTKTALASSYAAIRGLAIANNILYFTTYTFSTNKVIKYNLENNSIEDYVTTNLNQPRNLEIDKLGNMYITNRGNGTVVKVYDINLKPKNSLLTILATNGTVTTTPTSTNNRYDNGTIVEATATPDTGYQFDGWSGDAIGNTNPLTITMNADKTVTAVFSKIQHTLNTNATNGTININPNAATYDFGTNVTLTATPDVGYQFDGWSGDATGNTNPLTITMDADKTVTATFSKTQHTLDTNATNGTININPNAATYDFGTNVTLTATPDAGYQFDGWSGDTTGNTNPLTITMDADKTVTATFSKTQHTLTTNATNGTININPNAATYDFDTNVTLTATPEAGYQFDGWSGDATGNTNPLTITMDADKTVTATFSKTQHTLDTNATNGTININPNAATYDFGTNVTLTATPDAGYQFDGWSGDTTGNTNPLTITMDADKTVTATFSKTQHTLTTNATNGTININPNAATYDFDTNVTLTATPEAGYQFDGWSGDASGNTNPLTITMDADKTVTATFSKIQHTLTTNATNGTINTNPNATTFNFGTDVTLTATPEVGYQFDGWSGDASGNTNPLTITMDADKTVTATFSKIQHTLNTNATNGTINTNPNATTFNFGTDVTLTATPEAGYQFDGWSGDASGNTNPLTITMDADKTVTAVFSKVQHTLTTNATNGTININPNATTYDFDTDVTLTAVPNAGYQFDGWSGDATGNTNPLTITMDADKTITATFKEVDTIYPYPNPANDNVKIYSNNTINIVNIKVIDLSGKIIIETANEEINISHLNSGLYMLRITDSNNKTTVKKLIKD